MGLHRIKREIFHFEGFMGNSSCQVDIYESSGNSVVIVSELKDNQGTSAINRIDDEVAAGITQLYNLDPFKTTWISHCPKGFIIPYKAEEFNKIPIAWDGEIFKMEYPEPHWPSLSRSDVEKLVRCPLDLEPTS